MGDVEKVTLGGGEGTGTEDKVGREECQLSGEWWPLGEIFFFF